MYKDIRKELTTMPRTVRTQFVWLIMMAAWTTPWWLPCAVHADEPSRAEATAAATATDYRPRLDEMMAKLEAARIEHHVPGIGIAVVHGDEVILCDGLGSADLERGIPVTCDTIFAIGSCTKAFTATVIAMLADEGKMDWDAHVRTYLPDFKLHDPEADAGVTLRDLVSHRSGLSRMGLLWAAGKLTRDEILDAVAGAEPLFPFRSKFNYSNINYIVAGDASGKAFGSDWETLMRARLLVPLQMNSASLSTIDAQQNPNLAIGYTWDDVDNAHELDPMRNIDAAGPAGSINASPRDMANWLRFLLARGEFNGKRLISQDALEETWKSQIEIAPGVGYALGWIDQTYIDTRIVEHSGNIDGFSAHVAFLPEKNLGFVLLMNTSIASLDAHANDIVLGTLIREPAATSMLGSPGEDFSPYVGTYIGTFAHFKDGKFEVKVSNGKLAVDVPGQMLYELEAPDDQGRRSFSLTNQIAVSFERNEAGEVTLMKMHQAGLDFELPREGVEIKPDVTLDDVREYLGAYRFEDMGADCKVLIQNGRLAVDVPGQMVYELHLPDADGKWTFRATQDIKVGFNRNDDGTVKSMTMWQAGQEWEMPLVAKAEPAEAATLDDVMTLVQNAYGTAKLGELRTLRGTGTIHFVHQGLSGKVHLAMQGITHSRLDMDLGKNGSIHVIAAGEKGWTVSSFDPKKELKGKYLRATQQQSVLLNATDWREHAQSVTLEGTRSVDGRQHHVVRIVVDDLTNSTAYVDAATGLVTQQDMLVATEGLGAMPITVRYSAYQSVNGVMLPHVTEVFNDMQGKAVTTYDSFEVNVDLPADTFAEPPADLADQEDS